MSVQKMANVVSKYRSYKVLECKHPVDATKVGLRLFVAYSNPKVSGFRPIGGLFDDETDLRKFVVRFYPEVLLLPAPLVGIKVDGGTVA